MPEYIEREALITLIEDKHTEGYELCMPMKLKAHYVAGLQKAKHFVERAPTADVVSREVFEQVKWERDTALHTLQEHGISLGEKTDVVEVKHDEWIKDNNFSQIVNKYKCSLCGVEDIVLHHNYCPNCGAKMDLKEGAEE